MSIAHHGTVRPSAAATVQGAPGHVSDAVLELDDLAEVYRVRSTSRRPVAVHDRSLVERAVRREVARTVLAHQLPALVAELVAAAADDLTPERPTDGEALADGELCVVEAVERCKAVLDGVALEALARMQSVIAAAEQARSAAIGRPPPAGSVDAADLTALEVATATGLGQQEVAARLDLATARTPGGAELRARLGRGDVSLYRACTIGAEIRALPPEAGPGIVESTLRRKDDAPPSPSLFRQRLTRACLAADREAERERRRARRRRGAYARIDPDGLGVLTVVNDADKVVAALDRADALARAARQSGDPRSLDVLRADVITDCLVFGHTDLTPRPDAAAGVGPDAPGFTDGADSGSGGVDAGAGGADAGAAGVDAGRDVAAGAGADARARAGMGRGAGAAGWTNVGRRPPAHVTVVVPVTTAAGLTDAPCEIPGHGPVSAEHARQIMLNPDSTWQRLLVEASTGVALRLESSGYRPSAAIRAHVEAVDGTCRGPGCTVPAARCDLDHDIPWPSGRTTPTNLTNKHRLHHNVRTHGHWQAVRDPDDHLVHWRTSTGRRYTSRPQDWLEAVRDSVRHPRLPAAPDPRGADSGSPPGPQPLGPQPLGPQPLRPQPLPPPAAPVDDPPPF